MIKLEPITDKNLWAVIDLSKSLDESQKHRVADNIISIAQAYVYPDKAWPRAIYDEEQLFGFVMVALSDDEVPIEDQPVHFIWRLMIGKPYQHKGYGRKVIELLKQQAKQAGMQYLYVSCTIDTNMPYDFYVSCGFEDTHRMDDGEELLKVKL